MARFGHLNPYDLHKRLINDYVLNRAGDTSILNSRDASRDKTDADILRENHKFLWDESATADSWELQLAKRYYDKLFKEYCICDLSRYRDNKVLCDKVALRWRTAAEVVSGKGQFICGCKTCSIQEELRSWEVNFAYVEQDERKNALIKLRLCPECSSKLNYRSKKREVKKLKKLAKKKPKRRSKPDLDSNGALLSTGLSDDTFQADSSVGNISDESNDVEDPINHPVESKTDDPPAEGSWTKPNSNVEEKTREDEFDEYLEDLLL